MENKPILEVKDLKISFQTKAGSLQAIRGVSFDLEKGKNPCTGRRVWFWKTITVRAIMGIQSKNESAQGQILYRAPQSDGNVSEYDILAMKKKEVIAQICGKHIAMVFQDPMTTLDPTMTIGKQDYGGMRLSPETQ